MSDVPLDTFIIIIGPEEQIVVNNDAPDIIDTSALFHQYFSISAFQVKEYYLLPVRRMKKQLHSAAAAS